MSSDSRVRTTIGLATWLVTGIPMALTILSKREAVGSAAVAWGVTFLLFGVCFWVMTRTREHAIVTLSIASALALLVAVFGHSGFEPILLVVVAAVAGGRLNPRGIAILLTILTTLLAAITWARFGPGSLLAVGSFAGFMVFAALTSTIAENERRARENLAKSNAELQTALALLDVSTRAAERARIGRDLHDVIGHHLTALSLQLEVALHVPQEECAEHVRKAQAISKLLLSDVRGVVSDLRTEKPIDLIRAIDLFRSAITKPRIEIIAPDTLQLADPLVAQTALRAIQEIVTNATRHSSAQRLTIRIAKLDSSLEIIAADDGVGVAAVTPGNGLSGLQERVEATGGTLAIRSAAGEGFAIEMRLPLGEDA